MFLIVSSCRLIKYSIVYRPLDIILKSFTAIFSSLARFSLVFLLIFMGFALFGKCVLGSQLDEYATLNRACLTLTLIVFGQLNFERYYEFDAIVGTLFYCSYIMVVVIVMFNIVSAVITEAFRCIKEFMSQEAQQLNLLPDSVYIKRNFNLLVMFKLRFYKNDVKSILEGNNTRFESFKINRLYIFVK